MKPNLANIKPVAGKEIATNHNQLVAAFELVAPAHNWRDRIETTIKVGSRDQEKLIVQAITYFTDSVAYLTPRADGTTRITAKGYLATVGTT